MTTLEETIEDLFQQSLNLGDVFGSRYTGDVAKESLMDNTPPPPSRTPRTTATNAKNNTRESSTPAPSEEGSASGTASCNSFGYKWA